MAFFNKLLRKVNHINAVTKNVKMVGNVATGNTKKTTTRARNKVKSKIANKAFKSLKF